MEEAIKQLCLHVWGDICPRRCPVPCPSSLHIPLGGICCAGIQWRRTGSWICWILSRARNLQQRAVPNPDGFFAACGLEQSLPGPHSSRAKAEAPAQTGVGCTGPALSPWDWGHSRAGQWEGGNLGFSITQPLTSACVCGYCLTQTQIRALPTLSHLSQLRERGGKSIRHSGHFSRVKTGPFQGLWSLSGILGKFFLVKDSPPLPCSGRCLYGAFQVPEELWEDFLFPFCYMAESQMSLGQSQEDLISHLKARDDEWRER